MDELQPHLQPKLIFAAEIGLGEIMGRSILMTAVLALGFATQALAAEPKNAASDRFAVKLLQGLYNQTPNENIVLSPTSLSTVFTLVTAGAGVSDQKTVLKALGYDGATMAEVLKDNAAFEKSLVKSKDYSVSSKNLLFTNVALDAGYKSSAIKSLSAESALVDFTKPATAAAVNTWADKSTDGLIKEIVKPAEIEKLAFLGLNATFLDAKWGEKFDSPYPQGVQFLSEDGKPMMAASKPVKVQLMTSNPSLPIVAVEYPTFTVYDIPYKAGADGQPQGSFQILLPAMLNKADVEKAMWESKKVDPKLAPLSGVIASLSAQMIEQIGVDVAAKRAQRSRSFMLHIPKFKAEFTSENDALKSLVTEWGAGSIFGSIDMSPMVAEGSKQLWSKSVIALIKQKAAIEVSETGTKAAAVSAIGGFPESCPPPQIYVDRPFAYLVKDTATGRIVFAGTYVDPTKATVP